MISKVQHVEIKEIGSFPGGDLGYGELYIKSDNKLYFQDGGNNVHEVAFV